mmetsp:Transcript_26521/g.66865  ORF Transcript_26521/g.66865 Transcript_26521/m.66865 type:complete len:407 (-) Transcript_26521:207-1427(-)
MASQHWLRILRLFGVVAPGWCYQRDRGVGATIKANSNNVVQEFVEHDGARDDSAETPEDTVVNRSSGKIQTRRRSVHSFRADAEVDATSGAHEDSQMLRRSSSSTDPARASSRETTEDVRAGLHSPSPSFSSSSSTQAARSLRFDTNTNQDSDAAEEEVLTQQHRPAPAIGIAADDDHHASDEHTAMATESQTTNNSTLSTSAPPIGNSLDLASASRKKATTLYQQGVSCSGTVISTTCSIANESQGVTITCDPGEVLNPVVNCDIRFVQSPSNSPICGSTCSKEDCCMVAPTTTTTTTTVASTTTGPTTTTTNTTAGSDSATSASSSTSTQMMIIAGVVVALLVGIAGAVFAFSGSGGEGDGGGGRQEDAYGYGGGYSQGYGGGDSQGYGGAGYGQEFGGLAGYY